MRKPRRLHAGATYHVTAKANRGSFDIRSKSDKELLWNVVEKVKERHPFELVNFSFLDNHFHFLIKPVRETNLSDLMCVLLSTYTKRWNKRHAKSGHLWRARFWSCIVESEADFVAETRYIDNNPVEAHLVNEARKWRWGGLWMRVHGVPGSLCDIDRFYAAKYPGSPPLKRFYDPISEPVAV
jgi:REP element-mobilizing transposase RayT